MVRPSYLNKGDKIVVFGTGNSMSSFQLKPTLQLMEDWGLVPVICENEDANHAPQKGLTKMLNDETIRAVLHVNSDHGMVRMIDRLGFHSFLREVYPTSA